MTRRGRTGQATPDARQQTFSFLQGPGAEQAGTMAPSSPVAGAGAMTPASPATSAVEAWPLDGGILPEGDPFLAELEAAADLEGLERVARGCRRCALRDGCRGVVFGEGNSQAVLMFVGEGPGQIEDEMGRPFVGRAGQLLDRWIALLGLKRDQVYITNVVKCRPPGNRTPLAEEMRACWPVLRQQLRFIRPRLLVCLGSPALQALVHPAARITRLRGSWLERGGIRILGTFHPAAVLRDPTKERAVHEDLRRLRAEYLRIAPRGGE